MSMTREVFRWYDTPKGRVKESFTFTVEQMWDGRETDTLYTDSETAKDQLVKVMLEDQYDVRVTKLDGTVELFAAAPKGTNQ